MIVYVYVCLRESSHLYGKVVVLRTICFASLVLCGTSSNMYSNSDHGTCMYMYIHVHVCKSAGVVNDRPGVLKGTSVQST